MESPEQKPSLPEIISQLELLVDTYQDKLVHHAFYKLGNRKDAEDVVQDAFVKIFTEQKNGKVILNPPAYVYRLVANACIDVHRTRGRFTHVSLDDVPCVEIGGGENREDELIRLGEYHRINKLLDSIPDEQAEIVRFRFVDGLPFQQIADILELPLTTVKSRFSYGLLKIKTQFFTQKEVSHAV